MANLNTILSGIGNALKKFFGVAVTVATDVAPVVDVLFPGAASLYNLVVGEVGKTEAVAIAAGSQSGTGVQKLALVMQAVEGQVAQMAQQNGWTPLSSPQLEAYISAVVSTLNAISKPASN